MLVVANFHYVIRTCRGPKSSCLPFPCFQLVEGYTLVAWFTVNKIIDCLIQCMIGKHVHEQWSPWTKNTCKVRKQRVVKLLTCNFYCLKKPACGYSCFLVIKGLLCNLGSRSQQLQPLKFQRPDTACIRAITCLPGHRNRCLPVTFSQPCKLLNNV